MMSNEPSGEIPDIPELSGDYELIRELGRGGTAVVYLARDRDLGRDVAIKLIRPSFVRDEDAVARLVREARTVGKLQHPNIVMLLGTRRLSDGGLALILQYVPGRSLKDRVREEGPLPFADCERILLDLGKALAYAHRSRIVHRDLKPENVFLDEGVGLARLADFGIARAWDSDSGLTLPGTAIGTPSYMSPEQVDGRELDGRSDIYSLGLLGYEIVTGRQPWEGESLYSVIYKQKHEDLPPLDEVRPGTPENLRRAIAGAVRKEPGDRWRNADEFIEALSEKSPSAGRAPGPVSHGPSGPERGAFAPPPSTVAPGTRLPPDVPAIRDVRDVDDDGERPRRWVGGAVVLVCLLVLAVGALAVAQPDGEIRAFVDSVNPLFAGQDQSTGDQDWIRGPDPDDDPGATEFDSDPAAVSPDSPAAPENAEGFAIVQGDGQIGPAGTQLEMPLILQLRDEDGGGIPGVEVEFEVVAGGGSVQPTVDRTRPDGRILTWWTLGNGGEQIVRARAEGMEDVEAIFEARVAGAVQPSLETLTGQTVQGAAGTPLSDPVAVRLLDAQGSPVAGAPIRFVPTSGTTNPEVVETNSDGIARTAWTLGSGSGPHTLSARMVDEPSVTARIQAEVRTVSVATRAGIAVGGSHSCSLRADGTMVCWGGNESGQLGDGSQTRRATPSAQVDGGPFARLAAGVSHMCALTGGGETWCWGANSQRQLGTGGQTARAVPTRVPDAEPFVQLAAGLGHTCGLAQNGAAYCWGSNDSGQLGDGSGSARSTPARVSGGRGFTSITAGWRHTCALESSGTAYCWGNGNSGQLGNGEASSASTPRAVAGGHRFQRLAAGNAHTCGLTTDGRILCWGSGEFGQTGTGSTEGALSPRQVEGDQSYSNLATGGVHSCGLTGNGEAFCWGRNLHGQIGDGTTQDRLVPTRVAGNIRLAELESMGSHNCGRTPGGDTYCWGYNLEGQLGDGSRQNRTQPVPVTGARP